MTELRRVAIDPLTRVEGHGKVTLLLDESNRVRQARLHIVEFRGFEAFIEGRPYWEVPVIVQRLCGICPVSHHLAASKAMDRVIGAVPTASATALRRLMHYGQVMQSHALHFFHLASPDLLLGVDADVARRNVVGVMAAYPDVARHGVALRRFGQEIIRATAGKRIHGTGSVPGGMNQWLAREDREAFAAEVGTMLGWAQEAVEIVRRLQAAEPERFATFGAVPSTVLSLVGPGGALELYDGALRATAADGTRLFDGAADASYADLVAEEIRPWTYMKFPYLRALGPEAGWYRVGPLARLLNCDHVPTPRAEAERQALLADGRPAGALAYHRARMIEMLHAVEVIASMLDDPALLSGPRIADGVRTGTGVGVIEAPRGTLIHDYDVGPDDRVTRCNLIVSTTHNNRAMHEAVRRVAEDTFDGREVGEPMLNAIEVAIRAYDPCLSCATHAVGRMPLQVELLDAAGTLLHRRVRDPS